MLLKVVLSTINQTINYLSFYQDIFNVGNKLNQYVFKKQLRDTLIKLSVRVVHCIV